MSRILSDQQSQLKSSTLLKADHCVKCGLCSAQCPTYLLNKTESESPRGRVSLAQMIASEHITDTSILQQHVDNCLSCLRCEKICPSGVEFGEIMADTRALLVDQQADSWQNKTIRWVSQRSAKDWGKIARITGLIHKTGLISLFSSLKPVQQAISISGNVATQAKTAKDTPEVMLFSGCVSRILNGNTLSHAIDLLTKCGFHVNIPQEQVCCSALPYHKGLLDSAKQCKEKNYQAFGTGDMPILFLASACGATLSKYENPGFGSRITDITAFLIQENILAKKNFKHTPQRILVHSPCTEKNVLKQQGATEKLLGYLPGAEIISLKETTGCCGAAGDYMLTHPETANKIREPLLNDIEALNPDIIVTGNYTCGIHIKNGLREKNLDIPVMHSIELLLNQLL